MWRQRSVCCKLYLHPRGGGTKSRAQIDRPMKRLSGVQAEGGLKQMRQTDGVGRVKARQWKHGSIRACVKPAASGRTGNVGVTFVILETPQTDHVSTEKNGWEDTKTGQCLTVNNYLYNHENVRLTRLIWYANGASESLLLRFFF